MATNNYSLKEVLSELVQKVDQIHTVQVENTTSIEEIHKQTKKTNGHLLDHDERIRQLEKVQENLVVKVATGVFVAAALFTLFINRYL